MTSRQLREFRRIGKIASLGPYRAGAYLEAKEGRCAICDAIKAKGKQFTCGRENCKRVWTNLGSYDCKAKKRAIGKRGCG